MFDLPKEFPATFGRYRLLKLLGKGGMGAVYLAQDTQLDREVALKIPFLGSDDGPKPLERFYREARAAAALHHPNLCPVHDVGEIDGLPYMTMAYIEGKPLSSIARWGKPLTTRQSALLVRKLALALAEAHKRGVIHRDLKPSNVMIDKRSEPVVMDFGLARRSESDDIRLTRMGAVVGTPAYMPPEQVRGQQDAIGPACDIYSLGVILYELLTGRLPFEGEVLAMLAQVVMDEPPRPSTLRPDLDADLEAICLKAMAKKAPDRFASMTDFATALADYLKGKTASFEALPTPKPDRPPLTPKPPPNTPAPGFNVSDMGGMRSMAQVVANTPVQKASGQRASGQRPPVKLQRPPKPPAPQRGHSIWPWVLVVFGVLILLVAAAGLFAFDYLNSGAIVINTSAPASEVHLKVDGRPYAWGEPLRLRAGEHDLEAEGSGYAPVRQKLVVQRGDNPSVSIAFPPAVVAAGPDLLLFTCKEAGHSVLFAVHEDGTGARPLTTNPAGDEFEPAWSPDGTHIAFCSNRDSAANQLFLMNADGTNAHRISTAPGAYSRPAWMADGKRLICSRLHEGKTELFVLDLDNPANSSTLPPPLGTDVAWSPDGTRYAFAKLFKIGNTQHWRLFVADKDGKAAHELSTKENKIGSVLPHWSPDGKQIAFSEHGEGNLQDLEIFVIDADGSRKRQLTTLRGHNTGAAWSSDKTKIAFVHDNNQVFVVNADGGKPRLLFKGKPCSGLSWRPRQVAAMAGPPRGDVVRQIQWQGGGNVFEAAFSPGGLYYLASGDVDKVRVWEIETGTQVHEFPGSLAEFTFDGNLIVTGSRPNSEFHSYFTNSGQPDRDFKGTELLHNFWLVPKTEQLVAATKSGLSLWTFKGERRNLWECNPAKSPVLVTPDGKYFLMRKDGSPWSALEVATMAKANNFAAIAGIEKLEGFTPDGLEVYAAVENKLVFYNVSSGKDTHKFDVGDSPLDAVTVGAGGKRALTAHKDHTVRLWDVSNGKEVCQFSTADVPRIAPRTLRISADGRYACAGGAPGKVYLWRLP